jgi:hypothetical protein
MHQPSGGEREREGEREKERERENEMEAAIRAEGKTKRWNRRLRSE